jgi:hypothetical protein
MAYFDRDWPEQKLFILGENNLQESLAASAERRSPRSHKAPSHLATWNPRGAA